MITVWERDPLKKGVRVVRLEQWKKRHSTSWIDCVKPSHADLEAISHLLDIPINQLRYSINPKKRPRVMSLDKYSMLTVRGSSEEHGHLHNALLGIFVFKNIVLTIQDKPINGLDNLRKLPMKQQVILFQDGVPYLVYRLIDSVLSDFFHLIEKLEEEIDKIETQVLREPTRLVTQKIFIQKRALIYTHKALTANRDVVSSLEKNYITTFKKESLHFFHDLYNDVAQLLDLVSTYRDILTSVLDMYLSSVSNNLNKIMKTLTLLSAFVMVPTLISGIYGMNFRFMPELAWQFGYAFSLGLMMFSVIVFYLYFKQKGWIGWP